MGPTNAHEKVFTAHQLGDDDGCFAAALDAVREFGRHPGTDLSTRKPRMGMVRVEQAPEVRRLGKCRLLRRLDVLQKDTGATTDTVLRKATWKLPTSMAFAPPPFATWGKSG